VAEAQFVVMTMESAKGLLRDHLHVIRTGWLEAFKHFESYTQTCSGAVSRRLRANMMSDYMTRYMDDYLKTQPGVNRIFRYGSLLGEFGGKAVVRLKKLKNGRASNIPTAEQRQFSFQQFQMNLPGVPSEATVLIAGYELDSLESRVSKVLITCPLGGGNVWSFEIEAEASPAAAISPIAAAGSVQGPRARVKKGAEKKNKGMERAE